MRFFMTGAAVNSIKSQFAQQRRQLGSVMKEEEEADQEHVLMSAKVRGNVIRPEASARLRARQRGCIRHATYAIFTLRFSLNSDYQPFKILQSQPLKLPRILGDSRGFLRILLDQTLGLDQVSLVQQSSLGSQSSNPDIPVRKLGGPSDLIQQPRLVA